MKPTDLSEIRLSGFLSPFEKTAASSQILRRATFAGFLCEARPRAPSRGACESSLACSHPSQSPAQQGGTQICAGASSALTRAATTSTATAMTVARAPSTFPYDARYPCAYMYVQCQSGPGLRACTSVSLGPSVHSPCRSGRWPRALVPAIGYTLPYARDVYPPRVPKSGTA